MVMPDREQAGERTVLVFVHGSGDSARHWAGVIARLPERTCIALDLPGHGSQIDRPGPDRMSVGDYADVVRAELIRRGLSQACVVGHSLGSAVALRMALDYPALVSRIGLVGGGARLRVLPSLLEAARQGTTGESGRDGTVGMGFAPGHEAQARAYAEAQVPTAPGMLYRDLAACDDFDVMADLERIAQPALIIVGEHDRLTPVKYATYLRDHLADATLVVVPDAGHYVAVEAPDTVANALRMWLAGSEC